MSSETREFQAEVQQLLHLMIHSLYSNKEIFLRELVSNAADAADKLRFEALKQPELLADDPDLHVDVTVDKDANTITIADNGIGMSREEVIENLGTIARSGTRKYLESLSGDQKKDSQLIGQFGVGFYSAFIVADKVSVLTRRAGSDAAVRWVSEGKGAYTLEDAEKANRGTEVTLHLRDDEKEFAEASRLRYVITRYSEHIGLPIRMADQDDEQKLAPINAGGALWTRPKSELKDEDYKSFYQHLAHDGQAPLAWSHNRVEGNLEYTSLLYIPRKAPFDLWDQERKHGVKLYVKRVFILDHAADLLPNYLRFVRGLVDSADLPLNVSRELLQGNRVVSKIRTALVKRVLDMLEDMAAKSPEDYTAFWTQFGQVLKEGIVEDPDNRERIARLLRFYSTKELEQQQLSLETYLGRLANGQDKIYYLTGESLSAIRNSPHLEGYKKQGFEVLLLCDRVDEWVVGHLNEFQDKALVSAAQGEVELGGDEDKQAREEKIKDLAAVTERMAKLLEGRVESVRASARLTESPSCLVAADDGMSRHLQKLLRDAGQDVPDSKPVLEINPAHALILRLKDNPEDAQFEDLAEIVYGQAVLAEGAQLQDPAAFVRRLNQLILQQPVGEPSAANA